MRSTPDHHRPPQQRHGPRRHVRWLATALLAICGTAAAAALDFEQALTRLHAVSDALRAADYAIEDKRQLAEAADRLRLPELRGDLQWVRSQKTLSIPLGPLAPLAAEHGIASPIELDERGWRTRPLLHTSLPLYTGGAIPARRQAADAALRQAQAERAAQADGLLGALVEAYFGQVLATRVAVARRGARDGLERHLAETLRLETEGFATRAQRLQAEVARDRAEREYRKARLAEETARRSLGLLLRQPPAETTTALFVVAAPPGMRDAFRAQAADHPQIVRYTAILEQARQGLRAQEAALKPELFAFGQYDAHKADATPVEPDWAVGVGVRYAFVSPGRRQQVAAARARAAEAQALLAEVRVELDLRVTQAYDAMTDAQVQFALLESALIQTAENLRLQTLSFREGQATSLDVIDARVAQVDAEVARAQAAYQYDLALARLLEASGQADAYTRHARNPDRIEIP